jgi:PAS domain S-box-containing protein
MPEYLLVHTRDGRIVFANPAAERVLGCGSERGIIGGDVCSLVVPDSRTIFNEHIEGVTSGKKMTPIEIWITTGAANMPVIMRAAPITYQTEDAVLLVLTDITERTVMEKELEYHAAELKHFSESLNLINEKLKIMSSITRHDILNQLTVLLGYLEIAEEEAEDLPVLPYLQQVKHSALNIQELIEFTRDYQDIGVREPQWCEVQREISRLNACTDMIVSDLGDLEVYADPLFGKVFYNLLDNTWRHGERATGVSVEWRKTGDGAVILWEDNGVGVRPEDKERIFTRGFGKNTGLGMFLSKEILAITDLGIRETGEFGKGARFEIHIPEGRYRCSADVPGGTEEPAESARNRSAP